ncbi:MAG TPA: 1-deoxy-D-xylulose-5-phosphate synthase [Firmicutes bacterium]|nr:1-deoxy-D-xylulose-5-phosphate synthase [Candidatus Fermentithermobacillaceae bacterium]
MSGILSIQSPEDLKRLSPLELRALAKDIRDRIIETVSKNGGHLASSLGVVELTLALHSVFDAPRDKIVWDVGHQAYAHKLVTGRDHLFHTLRRLGGISGFPKRAESPYDVYDTGHASGSISYALGLAKARDLKGEDYHVIAVIGDGSLTSGVAFEGLNNAGGLGSRLIVVVNDNSMSISENVGGLSFYLTALRLAPLYRSAKARLERVLDKMPSLGPAAVRMLRRLKGGIKHFLFPGSWFESLGFAYYGPIDGYDIEAMQRVLEHAKTLEEPVIIHVVTKKGKGYEPAEKDPEKYHGPGPFDPVTGEIFRKAGPPAWNKVFGEAMCTFAKTHPGLVAITAAMSDGTGLGEFKELYPDRFFDVGIAESHAVTYAAGLAQGGLLPVVAIYSTFLQRSYDQIVQDVAQQNLKVVFAIDRAGLVGEDGETHHGEFDLSYLRTVPGMVVMAPKDERELVNMLYTALKVPESCAIRYPRGAAPGTPYRDALQNPEVLEIGKGEVLSRGTDANILAVGSTVYPALEASEILSRSGILCGVVNARFVKPLDRDLIIDLLNSAPLVVVEENVAAGGLGEAVQSLAAGIGSHRGVTAVSLPDAFVRHGSQTELRKLSGLDAESIAERVRHFLKETYDR